MTWRLADTGQLDAPLALLRQMPAGPDLDRFKRLLARPAKDLLLRTGLSDAEIEKIRSTFIAIDCSQLDLSESAVSDLRPLQGVPLRSLTLTDCRNLRSLEPLRGMQTLRSLLADGSRISDLAPLRGIPLELLTLDCAGGVSNLEALRGMPLRSLRCAGNPVTTLEPLRGMPLRVLEVYATRVKDLSPLAGIRLESLNAQRNPGIELRHLAGMPLADLNIEYCGLSDLGPIRGMPLRRLWLSGNQVASLTPLAGAPLRELVCSNNRITTLAPLAGSSLRQMFCANNPITSLDPFVEKPPAHFYFSSPTIPDAEYRRAQAAWSARPEWAHHARNVEILLALRRNDAAAVRALATEFQGHRYLLVPLVVPWADAEKTARDLGGHLVTFSSAGENAFVRDVAPLYPGVGWIGLADLAGKWCTGEAFTYDNRLPITRAMTAEQAGNRRGSMCASDTRWNSLRADESWPFLVEWEDGK